MRLPLKILATADCCKLNIIFEGSLFLTENNTIIHLRKGAVNYV